MADVRTRPTNDTAGNLPETAADAGRIAVYDNDSTDGRPASVLETPSDIRRHDEGVRRADAINPPSNSGVAWVIGIAILALLLFFAFRILF